MKAILAQKIWTMASWHWLLLFGPILAAWVMLLLMAVYGFARSRSDLR